MRNEILLFFNNLCGNYFDFLYNYQLLSFDIIMNNQNSRIITVYLI